MSELARAALQVPWVVGLSVLLAGLSLRRYLSLPGGDHGSPDAKRAGARLIDAGMLLLFVGLVVASPEWWRRIVAGSGGVVYLLYMIGDRRGQAGSNRARNRPGD